MSQHTHTTTDATLGWDPNDPHGINPPGDAHNHFVASWKMQVIVLGCLLFFTALTVGFYNFEQWIETAFEIALPKWINIAGAMSIAVVKGILVAAFFMQLRYDKALNTFVMLFCLLCVSLFLGFTMIDLGSRALVDPEKAPQIIQGGTGYNLNSSPSNADRSVRLSPKVDTKGMSLVEYARLRGLSDYIEDGKTEADFWTHFYAGHATHQDAFDTKNYFQLLGFDHHANESTANASHPKHGITPGLFSDVAPAAAHPGEHAGSGGHEPTGDQTQTQTQSEQEHAQESHDNGH